MDKNEFIMIRKRLGRTQKELSELLGISLKAVSSYEQGWRTIPGHVERQVLFLLSRKLEPTGGNCWDQLHCPEERKQACPAWEFRAGGFCWFINGTVCNHKSRRNWDEKITICRQCPVMKELIDS